MSDKAGAGAAWSNRDVVAAYSRALRREAHVLARHPELTWQQLHNRLQWEAEPVRRMLEEETERRVTPGAVPWLRSLQPYREAWAHAATVPAHAGWVLDCAISPDGTRVASTGDDGRVRIWNIATEELLHELVHPGVRTCTWNPSGSLVVSAGSNGEVRIWQAGNGTEQSSRTTPGASAVNDCTISPDGSLLATAHDDHSVFVWRLHADTPDTRLDGHTLPVTCCAFTNDSSGLVSGGWDGTLRVWQVTGGPPQHTLKSDGGWINDCAVSRQGKIAAVSDDGGVRLWQHAEDEKPLTLRGHSDEVLGCDFNPAGDRLATVSTDLRVLVWDLNSPASPQMLEGHKEWVTACGWSPADSTIISASADGSLMVWDLAADPNRSAEGHMGWVHSCSYSPDGAKLLTTGMDGAIAIWENGTGRRVLPTKFKDEVRCGTWMVDSRHVVVGVDDGSVHVLDSTDGSIVHTFKDPALGIAHEGPVTRCAVIGPHGKQVITAGGYSNPTVRIWSNDGAILPPLTGHAVGIADLSVRPDGAQAATVSWDDSLLVWILADGTVSRIAEAKSLGGGRRASCAYLPDGRHLVVGTGGGQLELWDLTTRERINTVEAHGGTLMGCAVGFGDRPTITTIGWDSALKYWDGSTGQLLAEAYLPGSLMCVAQHPSRRRVACGDTNGGVTEFDVVEPTQAT